MCISSWPLIPVCTSLQIWVRNKMLHFWYCTVAQLLKGVQPACPNHSWALPAGLMPSFLWGSVHGGKGERNVQALVKGWSGEGAFAKKNQLLLQRAAQSEREYQDPLSSMACAPHSLEGLHAGGGCSKGRRGSVVTCPACRFYLPLQMIEMNLYYQKDRDSSWAVTTNLILGCYFCATAHLPGEMDATS